MDESEHNEGSEEEAAEMAESENSEASQEEAVEMMASEQSEASQEEDAEISDAELTHEHLEDDVELTEKLKHIPTFGAFSDEELKGVLHLSKIVEYAPGDMIIEEGYYDDRIYFLISGKVSVVKHEETLSTLQRAGDVFGEMGIIDGSPRSASVYAVDKSVCLVTDASYIDRLSGNDRLAFCYFLYRIFSEILANRLRSTSNELVDLKEEIRRLKEEKDVKE